MSPNWFHGQQKHPGQKQQTSTREQGSTTKGTKHQIEKTAGPKEGRNTVPHMRARLFARSPHPGAQPQTKSIHLKSIRMGGLGRGSKSRPITQITSATENEHVKQHKARTHIRYTHSCVLLKSQIATLQTNETNKTTRRVIKVCGGEKKKRNTEYVIHLYSRVLSCVNESTRQCWRRNTS